MMGRFAAHGLALLSLLAVGLALLAGFSGAAPGTPAGSAFPAATTPPVIYTSTPTSTATPTPIPWDDIRIGVDCEEESCNTTNQSLAVAGGNLYVVYFSPSAIYFTRSTDSGFSFSPRVAVDAWGKTPALARREGAGPEEPDLYVAFFEGHQALFTRSTDAGSTWSPPAVVYDGTAGGTWPDLPKLAVDAQGVIYVTWYYMTDGFGGPFFLARSSDAGLSWSTPITMTAPYTYSVFIRSESCSLVTRGGILYFAWEGSPSGHGTPMQVTFIRSTDGGQSWSPPVRVDDAPQDYPLIQMMAMDVAPDGTLYVQWNDDRLRYAYGLTYLSRSTDGGATWSPGVRVDDAGEHFRSSGSGALAAGADGEVYIALEDGRHYWDYPFYFGWNDLFLAESTDGGQSWLPNEQISDPIDMNIVFLPSTRLQDGVVYTVFQGNDSSGMHKYLWLDRHNGWPMLRPSPTPTRTPTFFPNPTKTAGPTSTSTPPPTATATGTPAPTRTATASPTGSPTPATVTPTPSPTGSPTPGPTATFPPTPTTPGWRVYIPWLERR